MTLLIGLTMLEFFIAALVVAVAPGPDNLFVLAQSATHGAKAGFCVICGLCTGIVIQVTLLVLGVSALIAASPKAFFVMQCLGAAYLLYLAYKSFRVRAGTVKLNEGGERLPLRKLYLRGIIMNITNPKAVLFALSFIPPAVKMDSPLNPTLQMVIFGTEFILATFIVFGSFCNSLCDMFLFFFNSFAAFSFSCRWGKRFYFRKGE